MAADGTVGVRGAFLQTQGLLFPVLIVASVLVIIIPMPTLLMDLFLACNITLSVVILLTTIYVTRPLEFSVFPALLLGTTLARLVLNVASTRLILSNGATQRTAAAGGVIEAFGNFVAGGHLAIGLVIFLILLVIQFMVITKGAGRISEVAARFFLDGMPGRQIAIDADLAAKNITMEQARARREELIQQADMYAAMDGAGKFVRGDAVAGIIITLINVFAGLYFGMVEGGMPFQEALKVYTTLTIGDGLVTQVPGFLISLASGLLITRSSIDSNLPKDMVSQLFRHPEAMMLAAAFLGALAFTGMPTLPMLMLSGGCVTVGMSLRTNKAKQKVAEEKKQIEQATAPEPKSDDPKEHLRTSLLELELGTGILADASAPAQLTETIVRTRQLLAEETGMIMPGVRLRSRDEGNNPYDYAVKIRDVPVAFGSARPDAMLAVDDGAVVGPIPGINTTEPLSGRPAVWIEEQHVDRARLMGYSVHSPITVITTHLAETFRDHAAELLSRQHVHELLENLKQTSEQLVTELVPTQIRVSLLHQVLCRLLNERVSIRQLDVILESIGDHVERIKEPVLLTEYVRRSLSRSICQKYRDSKRVLRVVTLDPALEDVLAGGIDMTEKGLSIKLSPQVADRVCDGLTPHLEKLVMAGYEPVVLTNPQIRAGLKHVTNARFPTLAVLSLSELTRDTEVESIGLVELNILRTGAPVGAK